MNQLTLQKGRPNSAVGRLAKELRCYDLLDSLSIEYHRIDHAPADNMAVCEAIDEALGALICKNLFLCNRQQTIFYLLMMPANKPFKTAVLSKQIGSSRLSFASPEAMERYLDITPGSVSVLGLMNDCDNAVNLLVDEELLTHEYVGCHPCINTSSLRLKTEDVFGKLTDAMHHSYTVVCLPDRVE